MLETQSICNLAIDCTADGIHALISFIESVLQSDQSRPCQPASAVNKIIKDFSLTFLPSLTNRCIAYCCGMAWHTKPLLSSNANRMRCKAPHTHTRVIRGEVVCIWGDRLRYAKKRYVYAFCHYPNAKPTRFEYVIRTRWRRESPSPSQAMHNLSSLFCYYGSDCGTCLSIIYAKIKHYNIIFHTQL